MQNYKQLGQIGKGAYGTVFKAKHKETGEILAVKKILMDDSEGVPPSSMKEITALKGLHHKNIVRLNAIHFSDREKYLFLLFEYCEQDMKMFFQSCSGTTGQGVVKDLMCQLLSGVAFCHAQGILHRDLKPQNLLITKSLELKIADFGMAKVVDVPGEKSTNVVTLWYRAPDVMLGNKLYCSSIDIWSVGCIFAQLANAGTALFCGNNEKEQIELIFKLLGTPSEESWPGFTQWTAGKTFPDYEGVPDWPQHVVPELPGPGRNLLQSMLRCNPGDRISAADALKHGYFDGLPR